MSIFTCLFSHVFVDLQWLTLSCSSVMLILDKFEVPSRIHSKIHHSQAHLSLIANLFQCDLEGISWNTCIITRGIYQSLCCTSDWLAWNHHHEMLTSNIRWIVCSTSTGLNFSFLDRWGPGVGIIMIWNRLPILVSIYF